MANSQNQRGGSSEQHAKAGEQSHKNQQGGGNKSDGSQGGEGRGFAGMDEEEQRRIASMGGKASHESGHGHEFTSEEAREAGRKGGEARAESNQGGNQGGNQGSGKQGGSSEQHAKAGRESHKNQ